MVALMLGVCRCLIRSILSEETEAVQSEQQQEYTRLIEAAGHELNSVAESGSFLQVFSFWRLPAFHDQVRTTLYTPRRPGSGKEPFVTITTWKRSQDVDKLRDPLERLRHPKDLRPTLEESSMVVDADTVAQVIADLSAISLPSIRPIEGVVGLDGVGYRFSFSQGYFSLDLSWWCDLPSVWRAATQQIEDVVMRLQGGQIATGRTRQGWQAPLDLLIFMRQPTSISPMNASSLIA